MKQMETERLLLREFRETDYEDIFNQVYADKEVWGLYSSIGSNPEEVRRRFMHRTYQPNNAKFGFRAVELKSSGRVIGQIHLEPHILNASNIPGDSASEFNTIEGELAFAFGKAYWGKGLAREACIPMIEYAFRELKLPRLVGGTTPNNHRSINLHKRLGYTVAPDPVDPEYMTTVLVNHPIDQ